MEETFLNTPAAYEACRKAKYNLEQTVVETADKIVRW